VICLSIAEGGEALHTLSDASLIVSKLLRQGNEREQAEDGYSPQSGTGETSRASDLYESSVSVLEETEDTLRVWGRARSEGIEHGGEPSHCEL
jgi:hypothetical protein